MYFQIDKVASVKALQRMLGLPPMGFFDNRTKRRLSTILNKPIDTVDYADFLKVKTYAKETRITKLSESMLIENEKFPYKFGDRDGNTLLFNLMLSKLNESLRLGLRPPRGVILDRDSVSIIKRIRKIFNMPSDETLDKELYYRILRELNFGFDKKIALKNENSL